MSSTAAAPTRSVLGSAVYEGTVRHRRKEPHPHAFSYRMAQLFLDLDELDVVFRDRLLWSVNRRNFAELRRSDFLGPHSMPLADAVRARVAEATGSRPAGPVRMLSHLRYGGHVFNPVSFYYCYGADGHSLDAIVAEITNTPWNERHAYVLPVTRATAVAGALSWSFGKTFHVSPFVDMDRTYSWRFTVPGDRLCVHMDVLRGGGCEFDATLVLRRLPLNAASLRRVLWRYPLMTVQVVGQIYWQALRLWLKGNPVHSHPPGTRLPS